MGCSRAVNRTYIGIASAYPEVSMRLASPYDMVAGTSDSKYRLLSTSSNGLPLAPTRSGVASARAVSCCWLCPTSTLSPTGKKMMRVMDVVRITVLNR